MTMRNPKTPADMRAEAARLRAFAARLTTEANRAADNAPGAYITGGSGRSSAQNRATERALEKTIDNAIKAVAAIKRAGWLEAVAADLESNGPERRRLARYQAREKEIARGRAERKAMRAGEREGRLGVYGFPAGYVYADKAVEVDGDYRRLAFLSYTTLILEFDKDCPAYWRQFIVDAAHPVQIAAGERVEASSCGQSIRLGATGKDALVGRFFTMPGDETTIWRASLSYYTSDISASPFPNRDNQPNRWLEPRDVRDYILEFEQTLLTSQYGIDQDFPIVLAFGRTYPRLTYIEARCKDIVLEQKPAKP